MEKCTESIWIIDGFVDAKVEDISMSDTIMTKCGAIRGTKCQWDDVVAYKGIRYATAKRWEYPTLVSHWDGVYDATQYGNCCFQPRTFYDEEKMEEKVFYYNEFRKGETYTYDEDCLFLNIWVPENATPDSNLPVIFYIHGGGYKGGCGHEKHFDGPVWPTKGVIGITFNYRLGPMGFMCLPELKEEAGHTGNYGLYDQVAALQWVQDNIKEFGGNPKNVTIMGQSAGAMSVQQLCISPLTDGLFTRAIMHSGGGVSKLMDSKATTEDRYEFWEKVLTEAGCKNLEELRALDVEKLFQAWQTIRNSNIKYGMAAAPCIDGKMLLESPLNAATAGKQKDIVYLVGSTSEDMAPPIIHGMARDWCKLQYTQNKQPSYCWFMDRKMPGDNNGSWHSAELWYFFGTLKNCWRPFTRHDYELSDKITTYLCNFAKTGNPNGEGLEEWLPTTISQKKVLCWGEKKPHMGKPNTLKLIYTMLTNKSVGE